MIDIYDRIKETTYTIGTGNFALSGVVRGFSSFSSVYSNSGELFYAVTDGTNYEIGSGLYLSPSNQIKRFPTRSTNGNNLVSFTEGLKEICVNYPATNAVFNTSGLFPIPQNSGMAFWNSSSSLSYSNKFTVDSGNGRIGINKSNPTASIDVGGPSLSSNIKASGFIVGSSGVYFPSGNNGLSSYSGGVQLTHYEMNQTDVNSSYIIQLSGNVNQNILLKKQNANMVFAGPSGGCTPPCEPAYPNFRLLAIEDIPSLSSLYYSLESGNVLSSRINSVSGVLNSKVDSVSGVLNSQILSIFQSILTSNNNSFGRLSLSSTDSIYNGSGTTLYFVPHDGNSISLYNGTLWNNVNFISKIVSTFSSLNPGTIYDVFGYLNGSDINFELVSWTMYSFGQAPNSYRSVGISKFQGIYCKTSDNTRRYIGTIRTGSSAFIDNETNRFICNYNNKIQKRIRSDVISDQEPQYLLTWIYNSSIVRKIPYIPQIEIVNGLDSEINLKLVLDCQIPYSRSAYTLGIVRDSENFYSSVAPPISPESPGSVLDYINSEAFDYSLSNLYSYESVVLHNTFGQITSDFLSGDYQDATIKTLTAFIRCKPIGYEKYYGIEMTHIGSPIVGGNILLNSYGIMGIYEC